MLAAGLAAVTDRAILVCRFDAVTRIAGPVQCHEELLGVAVESALAGLVGRHFDKGVVSAFLSNAQLKFPQVSLEHSRPRGVTGALHSDLGEKIIRYSQYVSWCKLSSEEVTHIGSQVPGSVAGCTV
jgi:hypothetical protein